VAFAVSLVRDRLYAQDFSDVEFAAAELAPQTSLPGGEAPSSTEHGGSTTIAMGNP